MENLTYQQMRLMELASTAVREQQTYLVAPEEADDAKASVNAGFLGLGDDGSARLTMPGHGYIIDLNTNIKEKRMAHTRQDLQIFATEFRDGLIGTQPKASHGMCALVSIPLRAALKILLGVETNVVTADGHTFLVTADEQTRIDPTIDQFQQGPGEKVLVAQHVGVVQYDERLTALPFSELLENFKRISINEGHHPGAKDAGAFVATYIYYPLAQTGFFEGRMK